MWAVAEIFRARFEELDQVDAVRELVLEAAQGYGFFSVWMTVFEDEPTIRAGLVQLFSGTDPSCFTPDGKPINRPGRII